jgi:hypothetical protein
MNLPWLGGGGSPKPVRADIPDLVAANIMAILYTSQPGPSMACQVNLVRQPRRVKAARARRTPNYGDGAELGKMVRNLFCFT